MVSAKGTLVKRLDMSKEQRKDSSGFNFSRRISSAKRKESLMQLLEYISSTGWRRVDKYLANWCWDGPIIDKIGRRGTSGLWVFGSPYNLGLCEPVGRISLYSNSVKYSQKSYGITKIKMNPAFVKAILKFCTTKTLFSKIFLLYVRDHSNWRKKKEPILSEDLFSLKITSSTYEQKKRKHFLSENLFFSEIACIYRKNWKWVWRQLDKLQQYLSKISLAFRLIFLDNFFSRFE